MDESEVQKLIREEARVQLIIAERAMALTEAEESVARIKDQLKDATIDLKDIRRRLMAARVSYKPQA